MNIAEFIKSKYGEEIFKNSFDPDKQQMKSFSDLEPLKRCLSKEQSQSIVRDINKKIGDELKEGKLKEEDINKHEWAFDLPAWVGPFAQGKIMLIGLEPHIEGHNYQLTYDIDVVALQKDKSDRRSKPWKFWERVIELTRNGEFPDSESEWTEFFGQFYVTDLCHFAPKGRQSLIGNIKNWSNVRKETARRFLVQEIDIVKPKMIITHGRDAAEQLCIALGMEREDYPLPDLKELDLKELDLKELKNGVPHLSVWHLGSNQTARYWNNKIAKDRARVKFNEAKAIYHLMKLRQYII